MVLRAAFYAAIIAFAYPVESRRIGNRQGTKHDRMDQGEDRRSAADSQSEREHGCQSEDRRLPELTHHISKIAEKFLHGTPLPLVTNTSET